MKNLKKITSAVLALTLALSLTACGGKAETPDTPDEPAQM